MDHVTNLTPGSEQPYPVVKPVDWDTLPEDVKQYRMERARNWPTKKTTEQKEKENEERAARGELGTAEDEVRAARKRRLKAGLYSCRIQLTHSLKANCFWF
jgi:hypothetical protein